MKEPLLEELIRSEHATAAGIDNTPDAASLAHLKELVENMLQPIRDAYGKGIKVSSAYRNKQLNKLVGGAATSSHMYGYAADIKPVDGNMKALQRIVMEWSKTHNFDQIIIEQPINFVASWIHIGWKRGTSGVQRKNILYAKKINGRWNYYGVQKGSRYYNP
ncbi:D-Ala-D-Ala carboxypeptidase family metallohydrolase [Prevotella lacticifex]|uniref:Peptidase M15A C-terminal domain-containing protein n=1 Tax=Prevotella lacticifex TaxID=2854755 RepID=A0A9R1CAJ5_9BACT|nr:D-Ala-D-Ala carboxypeptidase family metallohydrolase [Prevotella lacticifex]GJG35778.1 hypothetical protein PRLR5003_09350 [Prevotella lacticifex]GJG39173.1 hypothetical protein PRLR5019_11440 [Prevotella lacticifex]GJG42147.1 hypothetical protein PRLR5025_09330 [Prevotella lacticifex]GJG45527.1 hypothetical protein PRLR5027_11220 [Prevotella lacticifex]GJG48498.1 hypothetical protein PRLR5052_09110 [Prevotella lacticifex]